MTETRSPTATTDGAAVFRLPDLGEGLTEATILGWRVGPGDTVVVDQPVVEVETAKAAVEVPVPFAGTVTALHAAAGEQLAVGAPLITVAIPIAPAPDAAGLAEPGVTTPEPGSGNVLVGYGTSARPARARRRRASPARVQHAGTGAAAPEPPTATVPVISPIVRKLARDAGLDLTTIAGSGPSGTIRRADLDGVGNGVDRAGRGPASGTASGPRRIRLAGARGLAAARFARSRREIPEATVWVDVDATELLAARAALDGQVSVLALVARFAVLALRRYPELNARVEGDEVVLLDRVGLGFAAQTDRGLVVPVVPDAHRLSTRELSAALAERTAAAREGRLTPRELSGGTFTVNNYGVFGVDGSAAIINHPEVAILGLGRIADKPWVVDGELAVRKVTELTLAFDHRACDGGTAGGFLRYVADCVESPLRALGDA
jgi:pyruvate dehydrogenase E2 component (dihydrolipoamide acetyltransferase)